MSKAKREAKALLQAEEDKRRRDNQTIARIMILKCTKYYDAMIDRYLKISMLHTQLFLSQHGLWSADEQKVKDEFWQKYLNNNSEV